MRSLILLIHSLFSIETASIFYSEEDDLRSWFYSKYLVEQERQEHIKRLREQGIIIPEEELVEEKGASFFEGFPQTVLTMFISAHSMLRSDFAACMCLYHFKLSKRVLFIDSYRGNKE